MPGRTSVASRACTAVAWSLTITIMAIHESKESWERFRDGILTPRMQHGIEAGSRPLPEETEIDVYKVTP